VHVRLLRALARRPGTVVPAADLAGCLPDGRDGRAVDAAVAGLRAALGVPVLESVEGRGHRLAG
jgi:uroporphyrinogen-III synthase